MKSLFLILIFTSVLSQYVDLALMRVEELVIRNQNGVEKVCFDTGIANIGDADFSVKSNVSLGGRTSRKSNAYQKVYQNGRYIDKLIGQFEYHPTHRHWHLEAVAKYTLLSATGRTEGQSSKVSFCLLDSYRVDPNSDGEPKFTSCYGSAQGISPGFVDLYDNSIPGQCISIQGKPNGIYVLEMEVNPRRIFVEKNYSNNKLRIRFEIKGNRRRRGRRTVNILNQSVNCVRNPALCNMDERPENSNGEIPGGQRPSNNEENENEDEYEDEEEDEYE